MLGITHLVFAILLISIFRLDRTQAFAVLMFGVLIDLDHTFGLVQFVGQEGWRGALDINAALASNIQWKSLMHSPEAIFLVAPVAASFRLALPLVAWAAHLLMDYVQISYLGVMSGVEFLFLGALLLVLLTVELRERRLHAPGITVRGLLVWEVVRVGTWVGDLPIIWQVRMRLGPRGTAL